MWTDTRTTHIHTHTHTHTHTRTHIHRHVMCARARARARASRQVIMPHQTKNENRARINVAVWRPRQIAAARFSRGSAGVTLMWIFKDMRSVNVEEERYEEERNKTNLTTRALATDWQVTAVTRAAQPHAPHPTSHPPHHHCFPHSACLRRDQSGASAIPLRTLLLQTKRTYNTYDEYSNVNSSLYLSSSFLIHFSCLL